MTLGELPPRGPDLRGVLLERRYQLDHVLGSGGSGDVYAALDRRLRRAVAVKVLFPEYARDEDQRRRIRQEALVGAQVSHPNVAPIFDFGEEVGAYREALLFIVMPLLEGRTLRELVAGGRLLWRAASVWVHQLLRGVAALHDAGALHRDLKPENCLLAREGDGELLKVLDLGLAKVTRENLLSRRPRSIRGRLVGTPLYVAPEQVLGEDVDERADVYAAGVILFELLAGRPPFVGGEFEVLAAHVGEPPPRLRELAPRAELPAALEAVVETALAKDRRERFASAREFDAALVDVLVAHGVDVRESPSFAGCGEAQASLAAWHAFDRGMARARAEAAAKLNRAWSPLALLLSLASES